MHSTDSRIPLFEVCLYCVIWTLACWLYGKFQLLNGLMHTHGTKFSRQSWCRRADRHQCWRCVSDGQLTTALPSMPLVCNIGISTLIMRKNYKSWTDRCTLMEQSLADRNDGEKLIDTKIGDVHSMDSRLRPSKLCLWYDCWVIGKTQPVQRICVHSWNNV